MRTFYLALYYAFAKRFPTQPMPGWRLGYRIRYWLCRRILADCGEGVLIKQNCYFGTGARLRIGDRSQLGENARIDNDVIIGKEESLCDFAPLRKTIYL